MSGVLGFLSQTQTSLFLSESLLVPSDTDPLPFFSYIPSLMASIYHAITATTNPYLIPPRLTHNRSSTLPLSNSTPHRFVKNVAVFAQHTNSSVSTSSSIDFNDPNWKIKFQQDFESRFRLPHITDIFPHSPPIPSTFCLKMRFVFFSQYHTCFLYLVLTQS